MTDYKVAITYTHNIHKNRKGENVMRLKRRKLQSNVIVTYNNLPEHLYEANDDNEQAVYNISFWVDEKTTEEQVWMQMLRETMQHIPGFGNDVFPQYKHKDFLHQHICKISTATNWNVWEKLTGKKRDTDFDGKFYFARNPQHMTDIEKWATKYLNIGIAKDAYVQDLTPEEKAWLLKGMVQ